MSRNIRTFGDLGNDDRDSDNDSTGEGPEDNNGQGRQQDFYVGSGQQVQGPRGPGSSNPNDVFRQVLNSARANGADALTPEQAAAQPAGADGQETVRVVLNFWQNGFSIEDGPLRGFQEPENSQFLKNIMEGNLPPEIQRQYPGKVVDLHVEKKETEYVTPKIKPFSGSGVRLGNVVPNLVENQGSSAAPVAVATTDDENSKNLENAKKELNVNAEQPTTNIQIRLPNNQRIVAIFNQSHTVSAVRNFACAAHPELAFSPFQLMTTYPNKVIDDETLTLKDANLLNTVLAIKPQA